MNEKKKKLLIFVLMPIVMIIVVVLSLFVESKNNEKAKEQMASEEATLSKEEQIEQMLLAEYQKSQSTREFVEQNAQQIQEPTVGDEEYDDMIGNAEDDAPEIVDVGLSADDEAIIAQAEKEAWASQNSINYNGINVTCSMNTVQTNGEWVLTLTDAELSAAHPLLLQYDSRWATYPYGTGTMKSSACGPTCFAMVITSLTNITNASPPLVATYSMSKNYYVTGVGTSHALFTVGCSDFGLYCNEVSVNEAEMKSHLDNGEMLVLSVHYGNFTHSGSGHFIVIYGYNENGFMVNDPGSYERSCKYWTYDVIAGDINKIYALGKL